MGAFLSFLLGQQIKYFNEKKKRQAISTNQELKNQQQLLRVIVKEFQLEIQEAQSFGKKMKDPKKFKQFQAIAFQNYIEKIKQMNLSEYVAKEQGKNIKLVVGRISSGKSSLINTFFDIQLPVGIGQTTLDTALVYRDNGVQIYDTPGECQIFDTKTLDKVQYIALSDEVYILYAESLKTIQHMVRVIAVIKPNHTFLLRTQCDLFSQGSNKTVKEEIQEDYKILKKWNLSDLKIFATSAKIKDGFQNDKVKAMMIANNMDSLQKIDDFVQR